MKILVIDDNAVLARTLVRLLRHDEVVVETDSPGSFAKVMDAAAVGVPFDVVLCDLSMPAMDGHQVLAGLRALIDPPILILMTGYDHIVNGVVDADGVLTKPFSCAAVHELIEQIRGRPVLAPILAAS